MEGKFKKITKINLLHSFESGGVFIETIKITRNNKSKKLHVNKWLEADGEKLLEISSSSSRGTSGKSERQPINFARNITSAKSHRTNKTKDSNLKNTKNSKETTTNPKINNKVDEPDQKNSNRRPKTDGITTDRSYKTWPLNRENTSTRVLLKTRHDYDSEINSESHKGMYLIFMIFKINFKWFCYIFKIKKI